MLCDWLFFCQCCHGPHGGGQPRSPVLLSCSRISPNHRPATLDVALYAQPNHDAVSQSLPRESVFLRPRILPARFYSHSPTKRLIDPSIPTQPMWLDGGPPTLARFPPSASQEPAHNGHPTGSLRRDDCRHEKGLQAQGIWCALLLCTRTTEPY